MIGFVLLLIVSRAAVPQCDTGAAVPVTNAPYSAVRHVMTIRRNPDGTSIHSEATKQEARDSKGRSYTTGERRWTTQVDGKSVEMSEMLVRIFDPVANTETTWDTTTKEAKVVHFPARNESAAANRPNIDAFSFDAARKSLNGTKLGSRTIQGLSTEGIRYETNNSAHECWFSPDLQIAILQTDNYPDSSFENRLEHIVREDPDVSSYKLPSGYHVRDVYIQPSRADGKP
jgi:hypothetical protein